MKKIMTLFIFGLLLTGCSANSTETENRELVDYATNTAVSREEITNQEKIIENLKADYNSGDYTLAEPFIVKDPFGMNSLSAYVVFPIDSESSFEFTVKGKDQNTDFTASSEITQSGDLVVPVYGLYADYNNQVEINVVANDEIIDTTTVEIKTDKLGSEYDLFKQLDVDTSMSSDEEALAAFEDGLYFSSKGNAYDLNGEMRIASVGEEYFAEDGLQFNADNEYLHMSKDTIYDIDMNGYINAVYVAPEDKEFHHDAYSAANGYVYALTTYGADLETSQAEDKYNMGSVAVYEQGTTGTAVYEKDLSLEFVGNLVNNAPTNSPIGTDLLHMNSITYDQPTDTIIISSQSTNMLIGVDGHNLDVKWTTADEFNRNAMGEYALDQKSGYEASNGQHNVQVNHDSQYDDGKDYTIEFQIFDNIYCVDEEGNSVYTELADVPEEKDCPAAPTSKVLVQRVNTKKGTIETIGSYEVEDYRSHTQSGWTTSLSEDYNFITYTNSNFGIGTDAEFNVLFKATLPEENTYNISFYRSRVISGDELTATNDRGLQNLLAI